MGDNTLRATQPVSAHYRHNGGQAWLTFIWGFFAFDLAVGASLGVTTSNTVSQRLVASGFYFVLAALAATLAVRIARGGIVVRGDVVEFRNYFRTVGVSMADTSAFHMPEPSGASAFIPWLRPALWAELRNGRIVRSEMFAPRAMQNGERWCRPVVDALNALLTNEPSPDA